jgi:hypothetical protein
MALVTAARAVGWVFFERERDTLTVDIPNEARFEHKHLVSLTLLLLDRVLNRFNCFM